VPIRDICDLVKPKPEVRFVVVYSFVEGPDGGLYYDVHKLSHMYHRLTILAYELNGTAGATAATTPIMSSSAIAPAFGFAARQAQL
jgi:sulfoxide reductase catalytic subunit YedY